MVRVLFVLLGIAWACTDEEGCSLNGVCSSSSKTCVCDAPWGGASCETLQFAPGIESACGKLCAYHGNKNDTTSWGGSVVRAEEDGKYYMFVAQMTNGCTLGQWRSNSEVVLARADDPLGPFEYIMDVVTPWAHNPEVIVADDETRGKIYALFALGDGVPVVPEKNCTGEDMPVDAREERSAPKNATVNFTIHWAQHPLGPWRAHVASILDWPGNWDYGAKGNWNPAPMVHGGRVFLMAHTSPTAFDGEAILVADSWKGPYRAYSSSTSNSWEGSVKHAEDPFIWVDKRSNWHALYHFMSGGGPGGHAYSRDGRVWSNISGAYSKQRPIGDNATVAYGAERPKLLFDESGVPTHLYNGGSKGDAFTIVSPLLV